MMYVESSLEIKQDERVADKQRAITTGGAVSFLRQGIAQPLLQTLRSEEARLEEERAELAANLGENHPKIINKNSQIETVRKMTSDEVQRILSDLEVESLKPSARIVSLAEVPNSPSFPVPGIIIPAAFAGSTLLAFLLALMLEAADTRIRSGRQTSQLLQIPNLGLSAGNAKKPVVGAAGVDCRSRTYELHGSRPSNLSGMPFVRRGHFSPCRHGDSLPAPRRKHVHGVGNCDGRRGGWPCDDVRRLRSAGKRRTI